jgi:hypothetical protein
MVEFSRHAIIGTGGERWSYIYVIMRLRVKRIKFVKFFVLQTFRLYPSVTNVTGALSKAVTSTTYGDGFSFIFDLFF